MWLRLLLFALFTAPAAANPIIINEFNSSDGLSAHHGATLNLSPDSARFGRKGLAIEYQMQVDPQGRIRQSPSIDLGSFSGSGTASLWVRGDGTKNSLRIEVARSYRNERGQKLYLTSNRPSGNWVTWVSGTVSLEQRTWRELTFLIRPLSSQDKKLKARLKARLVIVRHLDKGKAMSPTGRAEVDSLRIDNPSDSGEKGYVASGLVRRVPFRVDQQIELFANVINYTHEKATVKLQTLIIDRNDIQVGGNEISVEVAGRAEVEQFMPLQFEVAATTPPLTVELEIRSKELQLQTSSEFELAVINTKRVIDSFEQTHTRWWTKAGYAPGGSGQNHLGASHPSRRLKIAALSKGARSAPACLRVQYDVSAKGSYAIITDQYLPGGPATLGVWVKGDGSPHQLLALFEERHPITGFTWRWMWGTPPWDKANRNYGGPNRYMHSIVLGDLSSKEWRFLQAGLPGGGIGNYNLKLRGPLVDYPFEFKGFVIRPVKGGSPTGEILMDDVSIDTQVSPSDSLLAFVFASDPAQNFAKTKKLHARFENSALFGDTAFNLSWTILDAGGETLHSERRKFDLPHGQSVIDSLDMAPLQKQLSPARGPLAVTATMVDAADPARRGSHTIWLKKPDSSVLCFDFENERTYYPQGKLGPASTRSPAKAHSGKFALHLKAEAAGKDGKGGRSEGVRLNPALPGNATGISFWVFGDGSGAVLHPFLTDSAEKGRHSMWASEKFSLGPQTVSWRGWRQITLDFPNLGEHSTDGENRVAEITYPVDVSFILEGSGQAWIDEIRALTHLAPDKRILAEIVWPNDSHTFPPGAVPTVAIQNADVSGSALNANISITLSAADGGPVFQNTQPTALPPASQKVMALCDKGLPQGVYIAEVVVSVAKVERARVTQSIVVCDLKTVLGPNTAEVLRDENKLRLNIQENREADLLDWDNVEPLPGRFHFNWFSQRLDATKSQGLEPMIRLGYAADWAGSQGYQLLSKGTYQRAFPNSMHVPEDINDWSEYVRACFRKYRKDVTRWLVWANPNSGPPLQVEPGKMAAMLATAVRWQRLYSPNSKVYLGGVLQKRGLEYLANVQKVEGGNTFYGIEWKVDLGGLPPERGGLDAVMDDLKTLLGPERTEPDRIIVTGLDWGTGEGRTTEFEQAAYIVRSHLILKSKGIDLPVLAVSNDAKERDGSGLVYMPPTGLASSPDQMSFFRLKPSYLAAWFIRRSTSDWKFIAAVELLDELPQQTRCLLFQNKAEVIAALWRSEGEPVRIDLPKSIRPSGAVNGFGHPVSTSELRLSSMPLLLTYKGVPPGALASSLPLAKLDLPKANWSLIEHLNPANAADRTRLKYTSNTDAKPVTKSGILPGAGKLSLSGIEGLKQETLTLSGKPSGELFIRKRYHLTGEGQLIKVKVNGKEVGEWDLRHNRSVPTLGGKSRKLPGGLRDAYYHIPAEFLTPKEQKIELYYQPAKSPEANNSFGLWLLSSPTRKLRLTQLGPIYAINGRGGIQYDRNIAAGLLVMGDKEYKTGLGTHSPALIEYPLCGKFKRFKATVGIDRLTKGRGSAIFEVHGDDKLLFKTKLLSGFSPPSPIDLEVTAINRLTLIVKDGKDGPTNDYANWCDTELEY